MQLSAKVLYFIVQFMAFGAGRAFPQKLTVDIRP